MGEIRRNGHGHPDHCTDHGLTMLRPGVRRLFSLGLSSRDRVERDVDEELHAHLELRVMQLMKRGYTAQAAEREALARFGEFRRASAQLKKSAVQRERRMNWRMFLDSARQDVRVSVRGLLRKPGFAVAVALTLAFGIGANAAMVGIVDRLLLRAPEHVQHPEEIVTLGVRWTQENEVYTQPTFSYAAYKAFRDRLTTASKVGMTTNSALIPLGLGEGSRLITSLQTNADYFSMIGARPSLGRFLMPADDREPTGEPVAVISHGFWKSEFASDPNAIGRTINLAGNSYTVVGVAPAGFMGFELSPVDVWIPIMAAGPLGIMKTSEWMTTRQSTWIRVYARLKPGISPLQLAAEATPINESDGEPRMKNLKVRAIAVPLTQWLRETRGQVSKVATLLAGLSLIVVLIACTNVVNLMLSRAANRRQEVAVRLALGVTRVRLAVQLLSETFVLAALGAVGACVVAWAGGIAARVLIFGERNWAGTPVDSRIAVYILLLSVGAAVVAGLVPLLQSRSLSLTSTLKSGAREGRRSMDVARSAILVSQAALSVLLLVTTGLFARSLQSINNLSLGMQPNRVILGRMNTSYANITPERRDELFRLMADRLRLSASVQSVALSTTIAGHNSMGSLLFVPGIDSIMTPAGGGPYLTGGSPGFFATVGTRILAGRDFTESDNATSLPVAIVNETMARKLWPGQSAIGRCIKLSAITDPCITVVGVSENSRRQNWIEEEIFQVAQPLEQSPSKARILLVRPKGTIDAQSMATVRQVMQGAAPGLPYAEVRPLASLYDAELRPWRLGAGMLGAFALLALFLVAVGLFATLSFAVSQRSHEIGVRMALGARQSQVVRLIMRQGLILAGIGTAIGGVVAFAGGTIVESMLFNVAAHDARVFLTAIGVLSSIAVAATTIPALRAARIDPVRALRSE